MKRDKLTHWPKPAKPRIPDHTRDQVTPKCWWMEPPTGGVHIPVKYEPGNRPVNNPLQFDPNADKYWKVQGEILSAD